MSNNKTLDLNANTNDVNAIELTQDELNSVTGGFWWIIADFAMKSSPQMAKNPVTGAMNGSHNKMIGIAAKGIKDAIG
jgi:bacteriocin-like protein